MRNPEIDQGSYTVHAYGPKSANGSGVEQDVIDIAAPGNRARHLETIPASRLAAMELPEVKYIVDGYVDDLSDDQLMRKLAMLTEMARPLLAKLPTVIDVTHVGVDVGVDSKTDADTPDKSST